MGFRSGSAERSGAWDIQRPSCDFLTRRQRHSYLGERKKRVQLKSFAQSRSHSTHGDEAGFKFPVAYFQPMAAASEPDHLSIMKGLWSQVTDEEFNLKGLHNLTKVRPELDSGCLAWAGGASREPAAGWASRASGCSSPFRLITSLLWDDHPY